MTGKEIFCLDWRQEHYACMTLRKPVCDHGQQTNSIRGIVCQELFTYHQQIDPNTKF
jgi:hypothetical protein